MPENPAPKPEDDTYSDEEATKRRDATIRAMIGMKPKPHVAPTRAKQKAQSAKKTGKGRTSKLII